MYLSGQLNSVHAYLRMTNESVQLNSVHTYLGMTNSGATKFCACFKGNASKCTGSGKAEFKVAYLAMTDVLVGPAKFRACILGNDKCNNCKVSTGLA